MMKALSTLTRAACLLATVCLSAASAEDAGVKAYKARTGVVTICSPSGDLGGSVDVPFLRYRRSTGRVMGSGIVFSADGLILTANHIISGVDTVTVVFSDLREFSARVVAADSRLDVALLKVSNGDLSPIPWRTQPPLEVGETVFAIGTDAAFSNDTVPSLSRGIVSGLHRMLERAGDVRRAPFLVDLIETDAQVAPGESGGALVDSEGRLVGMCLAVHYPAAALRGRAFALPADDWLRSGLETLRETGRVPLGRLGVQALPLTLERATRQGLQTVQGVQVSWVAAGGPFEASGMVPGDVVTKINDEPVRVAARLRQIEMRLRPGSAARVSVYRPGAGENIEFDVTVGGDASEADEGPAQLEWRGMRLEEVTDRTRRKWMVPSVNGVIVADVSAGSYAEEAGLRPGDVILEVNDKSVRSLLDLKEMIEAIPDSKFVRIRTTDGMAHIKGETGGE